MTGVLATCQRTFEARCSKEVGRLISDILDEHWPIKCVTDPVQGPPLSVSDALLAERRELTRTGPNSGRVMELDSGAVSGIVLFQIVDDTIDPIDIVARAFDSLLASGVPLTRFTERLIPIQCLFRANPAELQEVVPEFMPSKFSTIPSDKSYCCKVQNRCNDSMKRLETIETVAGAVVPRERPVNLSDPDVMILIEIIKNVAGLTVVPPGIFQQYSEFKLRAVTESQMKARSQRSDDTGAAIECLQDKEPIDKGIPTQS